MHSSWQEALAAIQHEHCTADEAAEFLHDVSQGGTDYEPSEGDEQPHDLVLPMPAPQILADAGVVDRHAYQQLVSMQQTIFQKSPLSDATQATLRVALQRNETTNMDKLCEEMLLNKKHRTCSILELADKVSMNRRLIPSTLVKAASSLLEVQRVHRLKRERAVTSTDSELKLFVDCGNYDETPMPVVAKDLATFNLEAGAGVQTSSSVPGLICIKPLPQDTMHESSKMSCKLLQSEQSWVMLVKSRDENGTFYTVMDGDEINHLQKISSTDAKSTQNALNRVCTLSAEADKFETKIRVATTDDAKSNPLCEENIAKDRGPTWGSWRFACEVHKTATCFLHTFSIINQFISGILNCSLSVNFNNYVSRFKAVCYAFIRANLIFRTTPISEAARTYKLHVLRVFLRTGTKRAFKITYLLRLLPGDWRNKSSIEYILAPDEDPEKAADFVAAGVTSTLVSRFFEWPRHRWKGADLAVNAFGLLESIHGLLSHTYPLFCDGFLAKSGSLSDQVEPMPTSCVAEPCPGFFESEQPAASLVVLPEAAPATDEAAGSLSPPVPDEASTPSSGPKAEDNAAYRAKGRAWVSSQPGDLLKITRLVMEPLRILLDDKLFVGGKRWEALERAKACLSEDWPGRDFPVTVASKNALEDKFFRKLGVLMDPELWLFIDNATESNQALIFKLMSRSGCMVEELLRGPHRLAPFKTFQAMWDADAAEKISLPESRCLLDPTSQKLVHGSGGTFGDEESMLKLYCLALKSKTDIDHLESLHAWVRKVLVVRTQGWGMCMEDLSALWVLGRHRSSLPDNRAFENSSKCAKQEEECEGPPKKKAKKTAFKQNSWNMFTHRFCSGEIGQRRDWGAASQAYRQLSEHGLQELVNDTKSAKATARANQMKPGSCIFGEKYNRSVRKALRHATALCPEQVQLGFTGDMTDLSEMPLAQTLDKLPAAMDLESLRSQASRLDRVTWGKKQKQDREAQAIVQKYMDAQTPLTELSENLTGNSSALQHRPGVTLPNCDSLEHVGDKGQGAIRLMSYLHDNKAQTNLGQALVNSFSLKCKTIGPEDTVTPFAKPESEPSEEQQKTKKDKKAKKPLCSEAGVCLCSETGCMVWQLLCRFINCIKLAFPANLPYRTTLLTKSDIFAVMEGCSQATVNTYGFQPEVVKVWHIGIQYLSPFKPTFRECTVSEDQNLSDEDVVEVKASLFSCKQSS